MRVMWPSAPHFRRAGFPLVDHRPSRGFTLIELSIVLVIIGLIIGGVLVGRDLISAAEIRATIGQKEKFDAAVNAFRLKYKYLPGDIPPAIAASYGLFQLTPAANYTNTNDNFGNGRVDYSNGTGGLVEEFGVFWRHLADAQLIGWQYSTAATAGFELQGMSNMYSVSFAQRGLYYPEGKLPGSHWAMGYNTKINTAGDEVDNGWNATYSLLGRMSQPLTNNSFYSPIVAYAIDSKIDDGKPNTGIVLDYGGTGWEQWSSSPADGSCTYGGADAFAADNQYNINPATGGNSGVCQVNVKAGF